MRNSGVRPGGAALLPRRVEQLQGVEHQVGQRHGEVRVEGHRGDGIVRVAQRLRHPSDAGDGILPSLLGALAVVILGRRPEHVARAHGVEAESAALRVDDVAGVPAHVRTSHVHAHAPRPSTPRGVLGRPRVGLERSGASAGQSGDAVPADLSASTLALDPRRAVVVLAFQRVAGQDALDPGQFPRRFPRRRRRDVLGEEGRLRVHGRCGLQILARGWCVRRRAWQVVRDPARGRHAVQRARDGSLLGIVVESPRIPALIEIHRGWQPRVGGMTPRGRRPRGVPCPAPAPGSPRASGRGGRRARRSRRPARRAARRRPRWLEAPRRGTTPPEPRCRRSRTPPLGRGRGRARTRRPTCTAPRCANPRSP
mmetsp:Transcript_882/g.3994  ORF Transcript_882/g.3994 Transcript_882/m.3994 type:complete len:368 (-) Transcript_882:60-1163(-)